MGYDAGQSSQGRDSVAIGFRAGATRQKDYSIAIGRIAGQSNQGTHSVAFGRGVGAFDQGDYSVAMGSFAGYTDQKTRSVAIGNNAGYNTQGSNSVAIGNNAGYNTQGSNSVAIGSSAGYTGQKTLSVAIGYNAGYNTQGTNSVAMGNGSGFSTQGNYSVAIGNNSGVYNQGTYSIAIGANAGYTNQPSNSIILNASSDPLDTLTTGFFVKPINSSVTTSNVLRYDASSGEINYTSKTFVIDHPVNPEKYLVHACLEGPEAGVYYRGKGEIKNGSLSETIELPNYVSSFATDLTVQVTPIYNGKINILNASEVENNSFTVYGESSCKFNWVVYGKRCSINTEPYKSDVNVKGSGPYLWI
jgi:hypothetical protein